MLYKGHRKVKFKYLYFEILIRKEAFKATFSEMGKRKKKICESQMTDCSPGTSRKKRKSSVETKDKQPICEETLLRRSPRNKRKVENTEEENEVSKKKGKSTENTSLVKTKEREQGEEELALTEEDDSIKFLGVDKNAPDFIRQTEMENFVRVSLAVTQPCSEMYRDALEHVIPHTDLANKVLSTVHRGPIKNNKDQLQLIKNTTTEGYKNLDISLMYTIFRHICIDLELPAQNWGTKPYPNNKSLSDDIERIRYIRNDIIAHAPNGLLQGREYTKIWQQLQDIAARMMERFNKDYKQKLDDIETIRVSENLWSNLTQKVDALTKEVASLKNSREIESLLRNAARRDDQPTEEENDVQDWEYKETRIVLLGKTGAGKSSTGNSLLRRKEFNVDLSARSVTKICCRRNKYIRRLKKRVVIVDTPGFFDTEMEKNRLITEITRCIGQSMPGPHVFLYVLSLNSKFTKEEEDSLKEFLSCFGQDAVSYMSFVYTCADSLEAKKKSIEEYLRDIPLYLSDLIQKCDNRVFIINNEKCDDVQVDTIFAGIQSLIDKNRGKYYTNDMYKQHRRYLKLQEQEATKKFDSRMRQSMQKMRADVEKEYSKKMKCQETRLKRQMNKEIDEKSRQVREKYEMNIEKQNAKLQKLENTIREEYNKKLKDKSQEERLKQQMNKEIEEKARQIKEQYELDKENQNAKLRDFKNNMREAYQRKFQHYKDVVIQEYQRKVRQEIADNERKRDEEMREVRRKFAAHQASQDEIRRESKKRCIVM